MFKELAEWISKHPDLVVGLGLFLIALTLAILGLVATLWVKPKLKELDDLRIKMSKAEESLLHATKTSDSVGELKTSTASLETSVRALVEARYAEEIGKLHGRVSSIEGAKESERIALQTQLKLLEEAVTRTIGDMQRLQQRSETEIARIQAASSDGLAELRQHSEGEILRLHAAERHRLALEQAGQDVELASIAEQLARLSPAQYPVAEEKLRLAQMRLQALRAQGPALSQ